MNQFHLKTDLGILVFTWDFTEKLTSLRWYNTYGLTTGASVLMNTRKMPEFLPELIEKLRDYFESGKSFGKPSWDWIDQSQLSVFQRKIYETTSKIPHGQTRSYAWIAARVGKPGASRAVGQALKKNPFVLLVPCHRVISTKGGLGGFMGECDQEKPEVQLKQKLLDLEESYLNPHFNFVSDFYAVV